MDSKQISRFMGIFWILLSLLWAGLALWGLFSGLGWLGATQAAVDDNLSLAVESMNSIEALILETTDVISSASAVLTTTVTSLENTTAALTDMHPLIGQTGKVVTVQVPETLEGIQNSMPTLIATAKSVDETLAWLSGFGFTVPNPFGADWHYNLGINYAPEVPLDQALDEMNENLADTPDDLRAMSDALDAVEADLLLTSDDLTQLSEDVAALNMQLQETVPQLTQLASNTAEIRTSFSAAQAGLPLLFDTFTCFARWIMILLLLSQIPFLYMGWLLTKGRFLADAHDSSPT